MVLSITDTRITSSVPGCEHVTERGVDGWRVSWLLGRILERNQAVIAMVLAEVYALKPPADHKLWRFVPEWRAELGLPQQGSQQ